MRARNLGRWAGVWLAIVATWASSGCSKTSGHSSSPGSSNLGDKTSPGQAPIKPPIGTRPFPAASPSIAGDRMANMAPMAANPTVPQDPSPFRFAEIAREAGVDFVHVSGMDVNKRFPTANGSGVGLFDYDGDGKLDLYFASATLFPIGSRHDGPNRLYKNLGDGKFRDVTESSGLGFSGYCHGIVAADFDNDGDPDVFLCNYGGNKFFRNNGNGTFDDITAESGFVGPAWSSGGAPIDLGNDGDLDLYVSNYGEWNLATDDKFCGDPAKGIRLYCSPKEIKTVRHLFYRNDGGLKFTDVLDKVIVDADGKPAPRADGHGFGVVAADVNGDGKTDLYVANDMNPNFLFLNKGNGTFEDVTEASGAAFDDKGQAQSGMGADVEDVTGDGLPELFVTNFENEYNTLYQNLGNSTFSDSTAFFGLAADSIPWVGWGTALADFDGDGWPDSFVTNGHVDNNRKDLGQPIEYAEPPLLHRNIDGKRFKIATRDVGPYFSTSHVGRGLAVGDLDDDGDIDVVINQKDSAPAVLRNDTPRKGNAWVRLELVGTKSNRDAVGALVKVQVGPRTIFRQRKGGASMLSTSDGRLTIGLGPVKKLDKLTIRWPSGTEQVLENLEVNRPHKITEPMPGP